MSSWEISKFESRRILISQPHHLHRVFFWGGGVTSANASRGHSGPFSVLVPGTCHITGIRAVREDEGRELPLSSRVLL